jgi:hypothetical protein
MMAGSFADNKAIVQKAFDALEPGGYFETQDMVLPLGCDDGSLTEDSHLWQWMLLVMEGMNRLGRPVSAVRLWREHMEAVGFEDVVETVYKWPTNRWPRSPKHKELGLWALANMDQALEAATLAPLTRALGWSMAEVLVLVSKVREIIRDPHVHAYWPMFVLSRPLYLTIQLLTVKCIVTSSMEENQGVPRTAHRNRNYSSPQ